MNRNLRPISAQRPGTQRPSPASGPVKPDVDRLDALLGSLIAEHEALLDLTGAHREAVETADIKRLGEVVGQTGAVLERVHRVESERQRLVARPDGRPSTLDELMTAVDSADRERLTERSATLRSLIGQVRAEQDAVKVASEALANHMRGLMQQVASRLSHAGTYGRAGRVESKAPVMTGVDVGA